MKHDKMNKKQQKLLQENMFAAEITDFSKIVDGVDATRVTTSIQFDETSFEISQTLVHDDGSTFVRRGSASFDGQFNPKNRNGTEHSVHFANIPLKLITSTPKIANSIDPNNNKNGQSSEKERSKCGEIITTHQFHKVTCSGCEHTHWCPRTHQLMDLPYQMVEQSTGTTQLPHREIRPSSNMFTSTSDIAPSPTKSYDTPETTSFQSDLSKKVAKEPLMTFGHEISNTRIGGVSDIGVGDQEVPKNFGSHDSSKDKENETFNLPRHESTAREANKIPETSPDKSLTSKNGEPDDTVATIRSDCCCKGNFVHLPPIGSAETGTTKTPSHQENIRQISNMFTSTSDIPPSPTKFYDTPDTASSKPLDSRKRDTNDFDDSQRKKMKPSGDERFQSDLSENVPKQVRHTERYFSNHFGSDDQSTDEENETFNTSIPAQTVKEANETPETSLDKSLTPNNGEPDGLRDHVHLPSEISSNEITLNQKSPETRQTVNKDRNVRFNGPLTDISNVIQDKENLSKTPTAETSVAIDSTIQPKKAHGKKNERKRKPQRMSSRNMAKNFRN